MSRVTWVGTGIQWKLGKNTADSGSIPMARPGTLVLEALGERVFTPSRVQAMVKDLKRAIKSEDSSLQTELASMRRDYEDINRRLEHLHEGIETGLLPLDESL